MLISEVVVLYLVPPCISALLPSPTTQALLWEPGCGTHSILDGQVSGAPACVSACSCDSARSAVCVRACACACVSGWAGDLRFHVQGRQAPGGGRDRKAHPKMSQRGHGGRGPVAASFPASRSPPGPSPSRPRLASAWSSLSRKATTAAWNRSPPPSLQSLPFLSLGPLGEFGGIQPSSLSRFGSSLHAGPQVPGSSTGRPEPQAMIRLGTDTPATSPCCPLSTPPLSCLPISAMAAPLPRPPAPACWELPAWVGGWLGCGGWPGCRPEAATLPLSCPPPPPAGRGAGSGEPASRGVSPHSRARPSAARSPGRCGASRSVRAEGRPQRHATRRVRVRLLAFSSPALRTAQGVVLASRQGPGYFLHGVIFWVYEAK